MVSHHHPTGPFGFCLHFPCHTWRFYWHFFSRSFWLLTAAQLQSQCPCFKGLLYSTPLLGTETFFWLSTAALINHSKTQWLKIRTNINFAHRCAIGAEDGRVAAFLLPRIIWGCWIRIWKTQMFKMAHSHTRQVGAGHQLRAAGAVTLSMWASPQPAQGSSRQSGQVPVNPKRQEEEVAHFLRYGTGNCHGVLSNLFAFSCLSVLAEPPRTITYYNADSQDS